MAEARALLVVLEDLQWADAATLDLLPVLVRRLTERPVLFLVSYHNDELHDRHALRAALADLRGRRLAHDFTLTRLGCDEVEEMIRATLAVRGEISSDFVRAIHDRTDGNPFFVEELLRTLLETGEVFRAAGVWDRRAIVDLAVPATIQETILLRVARLDDRAHAVLRIGAVLGQRFELEPVRRVSGLAEDELLAALRTLIDQQLLVEDADSDRLRFRHALTRDTVYGELLVAERRGLHRQVAEVLEDLAGASAAGDLALHYEAAGDRARAREMAVRAARQAASIGAVGDAHAQYATALRLTARAEDRPDVRHAMGRLSYVAGDIPRSIAELREAADEARAAGDRRGEGRALVDLATSLVMNGDRAGSLDVRLDALALLEAKGDSAELAGAYRALGAHHMLGSTYEESITWSERALELAARVGAEQVAVEARNDLGVSLAVGGRDPARGSTCCATASRRRRGVAGCARPGARTSTSATRSRTWAGSTRRPPSRARPSRTASAAARSSWATCAASTSRNAIGSPDAGRRPSASWPRCWPRPTSRTRASTA
jgi:tetratricopeptide (TPR) repeat protein